MFTCSNASCGKTFTIPLKTLNLQQDSEVPYDACPYCLTEITVNDEAEINYEEPETFEPEEAPVEVHEMAPAEEKVEIDEAPSECSHYLGYLSEKPSSDSIPDECIMCKEIVTCMLKKIKM